MQVTTRFFIGAGKYPERFTSASRNAIPGPVKFPANRPGKLAGLLVFTEAFEKRAQVCKGRFALYSLVLTWALKGA